jgi:hypothetical protein
MQQPKKEEKVDSLFSRSVANSVADTIDPDNAIINRPMETISKPKKVRREASGR